MQKWLTGKKMATKFYIKMGFSGDPKNSKDERGENWNYLKNQNLSNYSQSGIQEIYFQNQRRGNDMRKHVAQK